MLDEEKSTDREVDEAIRGIEDLLIGAEQSLELDERILTLEADLARLLKDHSRALSALKKAFEKNDRDPYIATRLSRILEDRREYDEATKVVGRALQSNRTDKKLNYRYAMLLRRTSPEDSRAILYRLQRSFQEGDTNHLAHFWYARYAYQYGDRVERQRSKRIFRQLRSQAIPAAERWKIRDVMKDPSGQSTQFHGLINRLEETHGTIERQDNRDWIFLHRTENSGDWKKLKQGGSVKFSIGFNFGGPLAIEVSVR